MKGALNIQPLDPLKYVTHCKLTINGLLIDPNKYHKKQQQQQRYLNRADQIIVVFRINI